MLMIWIQVRDVHTERAPLAAARVSILQEPATVPRGLIEMWIEDPDGDPHRPGRGSLRSPSAVTRHDDHLYAA
jgi:hypothetical protein